MLMVASTRRNRLVKKLVKRFGVDCLGDDASRVVAEVYRDRSCLPFAARSQTSSHRAHPDFSLHDIQPLQLEKDSYDSSL